MHDSDIYVAARHGTRQCPVLNILLLVLVIVDEQRRSRHPHTGITHTPFLILEYSIW